MSKPQTAIRTSYLGMHALQEPFIALYSMLIVLLAKNISASPFQLAVLNMLKPTVSVLSFYWGSYLHVHPTLTRPTLMLCTFLSTLPFLFAPFITNVWLFVAIGAWYSLFSRAAVPASLEILKWNTEKEEREKLFSRASILAYLIGGILSMGYGAFLDVSPASWTWMFVIAAAFHIASIYIQKRFPAPESSPEHLLSSVMKVRETSSLLDPWRQARELMKQDASFFRFQLGFTVAGFGLMFAQPAIPIMISNLPISYMEIFLAFSVLKGLGFILASPLWARAFAKFPLCDLSKLVFVGFGCFLALLLLSPLDPLWMCAAYFVYGVAQAGSHLVWHLSSTYFSHKGASTPYSSVNVLMVGLRGAVAPLLGGVVTQFFGCHVAMIIAVLFCLLGTKVVVSETSWEECRQFLMGLVGRKRVHNEKAS